MAIKVKPGVIYKCQSPQIAAASIQVIGGSVTLSGCNVTENDPITNKLIIPTKDKFVQTDSLSAGLHILAGLPEWFMFTGSGEIWIKMGVDPRIAGEE